ncbi:ammonium transporter [Acrasis kona]|uniref:Ammonium transporter n=1 Tax=Acrasis kona TaxID=1008807 RepID=A0AAW2Z1Y9_9EUKA
MTPGLAFFYGGMVHRKNIVATLYQSMVAMGIVMVQWWFWGYSLTFAEGGSPVIGNLNYIMLINTSLLTSTHPNAPTIPHYVYFIYQAFFAVITPALISGSLAERLKFRTYCVFLFCWSTLVYNFTAHWVWSPDGWLYKMGVLDLAGGFAVHMAAGFSGLALSLCMKNRLNFHTSFKDVFKRRKNSGKSGEVIVSNSAPPSHGSRHTIAQAHSIPLIVLGTGLLWFGWMGFNGGSALRANAWAGLIMVNTNLAGAWAGIVWVIYDYIFKGRPTLVGFCCGAVCGLATVTPAAGYIYPGFACILGATASLFLYPLVRVKVNLVDDSLDAWSVHGMGGMYGCFFVGVFGARYVPLSTGDVAINGGWWDGNFGQLAVQLAGIGSVAGWSFFMTIILFLALNWIPGLGWSVSDEEQEKGLDFVEHGEIGYIICHENDLESETIDENRGIAEWYRRRKSIRQGFMKKMKLVAKPPKKPKIKEVEEVKNGTELTDYSKNGHTSGNVYSEEIPSEQQEVTIDSQ